MEHNFREQRATAQDDAMEVICLRASSSVYIQILSVSSADWHLLGQNLQLYKAVKRGDTFMTRITYTGTTLPSLSCRRRPIRFKEALYSWMTNKRRRG